MPIIPGPIRNLRQSIRYPSQWLGVPSLGPVVANQPMDFGAKTLEDAGGAAPTNTGGAITSASIDSGDASSHWQIASDGTITPTAAGETAGLNAGPYALVCTFTNDDGSDTATITITPEADAYDVKDATELTAAVAAVGAASVATHVYLRPGFSENYVEAWFGEKSHTAMVTFKAREQHNATLICNAYNASGFANLTFDGLKWDCRFLREDYGDTTPVLSCRGTWGLVIWQNCLIQGDTTLLGPYSHFKGFVSWYNSLTTNMDNADIRFIDNDAAGLWRMFNMTNVREDVSPGPSLTFTGNDLWDMGLDGLYVNGYWDSVLVANNYLHNPFIDPTRVAIGHGSDSVFTRSGAWTGAADGKKLFFSCNLDIRFNTGGEDRTIYAQGTPLSPDIKIWRDTAGYINALVRDTSGSIVANLQTAGTYNTGVRRLSIAFSVDTDRSAQLRIWNEQNGGGGQWETVVSAVTSGQTLDLAGGDCSFGGLYDGTESGGNGAYLYVSRVALWYGQAPDLTQSSVVSQLINDTTSLDEPAAPLVTAYGSPIFAMYDKTFPEWNVDANLGTGGAWTVHPGDVSLAHGDMMQGAANSSVTGWVYRCNVIWSGHDVSSKYDRPYDPTLKFVYYEMQGDFKEDVGELNHYAGSIQEGNVIVVASAHGISLYNAEDSFIVGNTVGTLAEWGFDYSQYARIGVRQHAGGEASGNVLADNFAYDVLSFESTDDIVNNLELIAPADYGTEMIAGSEPTTRAELLAYFTPDVSDSMLTASPKIGALGTGYFDHDTGTADHPRTSTTPAFTVTDQTDVAVNTVVESAAFEVGAVTTSSGASASNGVVLWATGTTDIEYKVTDDEAGTTTIVDWTSTTPVVTAGRWVKVRGRSSSENSTALDISVYLGATEDTWTVTTVAGANLFEDDFTSDTSGDWTPSLATVGYDATNDALTLLDSGPGGWPECTQDIAGFESGTVYEVTATFKNEASTDGQSEITVAGHTLSPYCRGTNGTVAVTTTSTFTAGSTGSLEVGFLGRAGDGDSDSTWGLQYLRIRVNP